jgi:uncharacterized protein
MMRWAAIFTDKTEGVAGVREAHLADHQAYLRRYKGKITLCGAMRPSPDEAPRGGLWLFEADTKAEVEAIIAEDPFQIFGLRATSDVYAWAPAPGFEDVEAAPRD